MFDANAVAYYPCEIIHRITCTLCGEIQDVSIATVRFGYQYQHEGIPSNWFQWSNILVCPKHKMQDIVFKIDDQQGRFSYDLIDDVFKYRWVPIGIQKEQKEDGTGC